MIEHLTPSAEICAQLPPAAFEGSVFVWGQGNRLCTRDSLKGTFKGEELIPAPTAEELMRAFPPTFMFTITAVGFATFLEIRVPPTPMEAAALTHKMELSDFKLYRFDGDKGVAECLATAMLELLK